LLLLADKSISSGCVPVAALAAGVGNVVRDDGNGINGGEEVVLGVVVKRKALRCESRV